MRQTLNNYPNLRLTNLICSNLLELIKSLLDLHNITLREAETFARYLEIYRLINDNNVFMENRIADCIRIVGVFIFCFKPELCRSIEFKEIKLLELCNVIGVEKSVGLEKTKSPSVVQCLALKFSIDIEGHIDGLDRSNQNEISAYSIAIEDKLGFHNDLNSLMVMSDTFRVLRLAN